MGFRKIRTIQVSERVFDIVCDTLDFEQTENYIKIDGWLECFNNCREQGYFLNVSSSDFHNENRTKDNLYIWACENRNSDNIMVIWSTEYPGNKGMFSEEDWKERNKHFRYDELQKAADFIVDLVKEHFKEEFRS